MNSSSKPENIEALIHEIDLTLEVSNNFIYGYSEPGLIESLTYGNFAYVAASNYFILYFEPKTLYFLSINLTGDLTGEYVDVPYQDIESFKAKKGLIQYKIIIKFKGEKKSMILKCNKFILNMKWQKENLNHLLSIGWNELLN